ncbi:MAG: tetraacyldisaccharide 4'-kinase [Omnitrophica bacterium]|nr:tetraacyldisaccharide 4'-kinase [Candidatus Omnitrophota bacterium]
MLTIKRYIHDVMYDERNDALSRLARPCLRVVSYLYAVLVASNHFFYNVSLLKSYRVLPLVISVGNITLGGTGKTPFAIMLAKRLSGKGKKTAILIRGYGEDEWKMLENKLKGQGIEIFVGRDRVKTAGEADRRGADTLILDDGFQHRRLKRDLDIVLLDSANPFGNRRIFPRGILREPPANLKRAGLIVLTKTDKGKSNVAAVEKELENIAPHVPVARALHRLAGLFELWKGAEQDISALKGKRVCIFSAICDPGYFRYSVESVGAIVHPELVFPDHYSYGVEDLERIFSKCRAENIDTVITTEKDAVKLRGFLPGEDFLRILVLSVEIEITDGEEKLDDALRRLYVRDSRKRR